MSMIDVRLTVKRIAIHRGGHSTKLVVRYFVVLLYYMVNYYRQTPVFKNKNIFMTIYICFYMLF